MLVIVFGNSRGDVAAMHLAAGKERAARNTVVLSDSLLFTPGDTQHCGKVVLCQAAPEIERAYRALKNAPEIERAYEEATKPASFPIEVATDLTPIKPVARPPAQAAKKRGRPRKAG